MNFSGSTPVSSLKEHFLANRTNKQRFVKLISQDLQAAGCPVLEAKGDDNVFFANTAVRDTAESPTTVNGEDTGLLILLCFHADAESLALYLQTDTKKGRKFRIMEICWHVRSLRSEVCSVYHSHIQLLAVIPHLVCCALAREFLFGS